MLRGGLQTVRYVRSWKAGSLPALHEIEIDRDGSAIEATLATPPSHGGGLPGWVVLGGVTRMGRFHPQLSRFAHALAMSGGAVIVPEIPEWRDLRLVPSVTTPTVKAAVRALDRRAEVRHGCYGVAGFSFGAPQAVMSANDAEILDRVAVVVTFGGYCNLERTLRCQLTGWHEWEGVTRRVEPDPYGRWVLASNYLTGVPGHERALVVGTALRRLALASTEGRIPAWDPRLDPLKEELRATISDDYRDTFDLFAPPTSLPVAASDRSEAMAVELAAACRRADPLLDPLSGIERMRVPVHLFHGRGDRLVPYTESLRFRAALPPALAANVTVTGLFAHSADHKPPALADRLREAWIFFRGLQRALAAMG